jgi:hypothetical protein
MANVMPEMLREKGAVQVRETVEFEEPMMRLPTAAKVPEHVRGGKYTSQYVR